ncbi:hypothetical protein EYF80_018316 [Liparis tanakae]|uniref:Uncharacterized protein n=1 Tax=Liparis tanakae TaxID=230148 RepID=A0A4Z2I2L1_9TELE|nr:hypothetical protein EYF80_018316 [Liparis tanakae]
MAVIPAAAAAAAAAADRAPLYQQRSRRKDKKRKTQATTTSELLGDRDQAGYPVSPAVMVPLCALPSQASSTGGLREWEGPEQPAG